ncbi:isoprenylcysteine carboxylmethyltransferase family protein [candidate division WOR-3 bacterium]|nr:isoprenylcysteine carboxylmethyltransferase family protein [candidate division WOR-3 bacterium]
MDMLRRIMPTTYFLIALVLSIILHFVFPIIRFIYPPYIYIGYLLILFGGVVNIWTDIQFKKQKTTVKPHIMPTSLETSGPFRISRHPMYLGMTSVLLGAAFLHGSLTGFLSPAIFIIIMERVFIPIEEENLSKAFGQHYLAYKKKVRRWI